MSRLPPPLPPPRPTSLAFSVTTRRDLDDEASLAKTAVRSPARSPLLAALSGARALLRDPRGMFAAAVWVACVAAGVTGVLVGHAQSAHSRAHAHAQPNASAQRAPRTFAVVEAREEITEQPVLAPGKEIELDSTDATDATQGPRPKRARARAQRRGGFGHLGADRVASAHGGR